MIPELIVEDGRSQRQHRKELQKLLESTKGQVRIASAYITDTNLLYGIKNREVRLLTSLVCMDIVCGATKLESLTSLIKWGVQIGCLPDGPRLHAKVYIFGDESAVVTSANLTKNALDSNIEVGVRLTGSAAKELTDWFDKFWKKADQLDLATVSKWHQKTAFLRQKYKELKRQAGAKPTLPNETLPFVRSSKELHDLLDSSSRFFVCNTNRKHSTDAEDQMHQGDCAAAWEKFDYPAHMDQVEKGDAIFMYAKSTGIIGIGRAKGKRQILEPSDPDRIGSGHTREWRVPVKWLVWVNDDAESFPWHSPNKTFFEVNGDNYIDLRKGVRKHFLRDA